LLTGSFHRNAAAQCIQNINFNTWVDEGDSAAQWSSISSGTQAFQNFNSWFPSFYVGPDTLINVHISGNFEVNTTADDDWIGFVFGYQEPVNQSWAGNPPFTGLPTMTTDFDFYLFDWKQQGQTYGTYVAQEGFTLVDVDGAFTCSFAGVYPSFWSHTTSTSFNVLQTQYSTTNGWSAYTVYDFDLYYTPTRAVILVDSDTIFDQSGCFEPGRFGFYNMSQDNSLYWNFNYELFVDFGMEAQEVCLGDTAHFNFTDTSSCSNVNSFTNLDTFYWDLGDGTVTSDTNPSHIYDAPGAYDVMLIAQDINGCQDTMTKTVYIHGDIDVQTGFQDVCRGDSAFFGDSSVIAQGYILSWQWDFGDGTGTSALEAPSHYYNQSGVYTVELVVSDNAGCVDTGYADIEVYPPPVPQFSLQSACDGSAVTMQDASQPGLGAITGIKWDVQNDGITDYTSNTVSHTYPSYGSYAVELKAIDSLGCRDSLVKLAFVHAMPVADFEAPGTCYGDTTAYFDSSSVAQGAIVQWDWTFGDGGSASGNAPLHYYAATGNYTVQLTVTTDSGCVDQYTTSTPVYKLPEANFTVGAQCENLPAELQQTSTSQSGYVAQWQWDFGDGTTSTSSNPLHDYDQPGLFGITLSIWTNYGCKDTAIKSVRIYPAPEAAVTWGNNVCEGDTLPLYDISHIVQATPGGDSLVDWRWIVNGLPLSEQQNTEYPSQVSQPIHVKFYVWSNHGCVDSSFVNAQVYPLPEANFNVEVGCAHQMTYFRDLSDIRWGLVSSWTWDLGNGNKSNDQHPATAFAHPGIYDVELAIASNKGCADTIIKKISVPETPAVAFTVVPDMGCAPLEAIVVNTTSISAGALHYDWFLNGAYISSDTTAHFELDNGTPEPLSYAITLQATSDSGCVGKLTRETAAWVFPSPHADFRLRDTRVNMFEPTAVFENTSVRSTRWHWDFDDSKTDASFSPQHVYERSGDYEVTLVAWNEYNCPDTAVRLLKVDPISTLYIPAAFTPNGDGHNDVWGVKGLLEDQRFILRIWNRWGDLLMESDDLHATWDGRLPDRTMAPNGLYTYEIAYYTADGLYKELHGHLTLAR